MARPIIGVTADLNDVYWRGMPQFTADIATWRQLGISSALLISGDAQKAHSVLQTADANGFPVVCGGMAETAAFVRGDTLPDTQEAAASPLAPALPEPSLVERACRAVGLFLDNAGPEERALALEALQIAVRATPQEAEVRGVVPLDADLYGLADVHADARRPVNNGIAHDIPFKVSLRL